METPQPVWFCQIACGVCGESLRADAKMWGKKLILTSTPDLGRSGEHGEMSTRNYDRRRRLENNKVYGRIEANELTCADKEF